MTKDIRKVLGDNEKKCFENSNLEEEEEENEKEKEKTEKMMESNYYKSINTRTVKEVTNVVMTTLERIFTQVPF